MGKKQTVVKQQQYYIAIDNNSNELIDSGTKDEVKSSIAAYIDDCGYEADEIEDYIEVFEISKRINLAIDITIDVDF